MGRTSRKRRQKKNLNFIKLKENNDESLMCLKSWLLNENCLIHHLIPEYFPVTGRGLKTLKYIDKNEVLIQLPFQMLITTDVLLQSNIRILFLNNTMDVFSSQCMLSVFLVYEAHLGIDSNWYLYLKTLPQCFTNPDFCSNKEKKALPNFILNSLHQIHNKLENDFSVLIKAMKNLDVTNNSYCTHCNVHIQKIMTFARYKWAYYTVNTRAVYIDAKLCKVNIFNIKQPNNLALAPFLDLFNHDVNTTVAVSFIKDNTEKQFYQIITLNSFDKESQVFINYGAHNNLKLYLDYGFFIPSNPLDEIYFDISDIQRCLDISKNKLDFITSNNFHKNMSFTHNGLNYNAIITLFVSSTRLGRDCWKVKIYNQTFDPDEQNVINKLGISVLNLKRMEYICALSNMKNMEVKTPSFAIAIDLVEELINILDISLNSMERTS